MQIRGSLTQGAAQVRSVRSDPDFRRLEHSKPFRDADTNCKVTSGDPRALPQACVTESVSIDPTRASAGPWQAREVPPEASASARRDLLRLRLHSRLSPSRPQLLLQLDLQLRRAAEDHRLALVARLHQVLPSSAPSFTRDAGGSAPHGPPLRRRFASRLAS